MNKTNVTLINAAGNSTVINFASTADRSKDGVVFHYVAAQVLAAGSFFQELCPFSSGDTAGRGGTAGEEDTGMRERRGDVIIKICDKALSSRLESIEPGGGRFYNLHGLPRFT